MAADHHRRVEEQRLGVVFAYEQKAYQRWLGHQRRQAAPASTPSTALTGAALERTIMAMAVTNPDIVAIHVVP